MDTVFGNRALDRFDVLVIGSGASGASLAQLLCQHGQKVLMLEAGANYFDGIDDPKVSTPVSRFSNDELKFIHRRLVKPDTMAEPRTFRQRVADGDRTLVGDVCYRAKTVGGGATHADLKTPRFMPQDFRLGSLLGNIPGANFADWPISYDALEPFYVHAERAMGVQGLAGSDPFEAPRSAPYPMPPGAPMYLAERTTAAAAKLGYTVYPCPTAVNSRPYDGRPACVDCGFCSGHPCPINAKGSPPVTMLRKALLTGLCQLWTETRAVRLLLSGPRSEVTGVEAILPDGSRRIFQADRYVLSAAPFEDTRLLRLSDPGGPGVGNSSGVVGRNVMFHHGFSVLGVFEDQLHGHHGHSSAHALSDFRGVAGDPRRPLGGIVILAGSQYPITEALTYATSFRPLGVQRALLKKMLRQCRGRDRFLWFTMYGEDAPKLQSQVDLDPAVRDLDGLPVARLTHEYHPFELSAVDFYAPKVIELAGAAGARYAAVFKGGAVPGDHVAGTLRFGTDPRTSVCDPTGRFHDIGNLYAADASLFPTQSGFNPTLTIVALVSRIAGEMLFPGSPERALA